MGDVQHGDTAGRGCPDDREDLADFAVGQGRRGLVHDQQGHRTARVDPERPSHCDARLERRRQRAHRQHGIEVKPDGRQILAGLTAQLPRADGAEPGGEPGAERQVVGDGCRVDEAEVLVHEPGSQRVCGTGQSPAQLAAADEDLAAGLRLVVAGNYLDQRRLSGTVLAEDRVYLAGRDRHVQAGEHSLAGERLGQTGDLKGAGRPGCTPRRGAGLVHPTLHRCLNSCW